MKRTLFDPEHEAFRLVIREFLAREVVPVYDQWLEDGMVPRKLFRSLSELGVMGLNIPAEHGGTGDAGFLFSTILNEEAARAYVNLGPLRCHLDVVMPYFLKYANTEQRDRWFPSISAGDVITAIAMTEPGGGSDLAGIRTRATRDGDHYVLNGAKTFITGGISADLVIVVARTSRHGDDRRAGLSLLVVETGMEGFEKGRKLKKIGYAVQDTAELAFTDVRVPSTNLLGDEGLAFGYLSHNLVGERLSIAVTSVAACQAALTATVDYVQTREVFGKHVGSFQNTKFELASVSIALEAAQVLVDRAISEHELGRLNAADAAKVKVFCTETQAQIVDRCLQLFGGHGYMLEYPIARMYADARVARIIGGTTEVLKTIISKSLGL